MFQAPWLETVQFERGQLNQFMIQPRGPPAQQRTPASFIAYCIGRDCCAW
jgi:hypothetical protein